MNDMRKSEGDITREQYELICRLKNDMGITYFMARNYLRDHKWDYQKARDALDSYLKLFHQ